MESPVKAKKDKSEKKEKFIVTVKTFANDIKANMDSIVTKLNERINKQDERIEKYLAQIDEVSAFNEALKSRYSDLTRMVESLVQRIVL